MAAKDVKNIYSFASVLLRDKIFLILTLPYSRGGKFKERDLTGHIYFTQKTIFRFRNLHQETENWHRLGWYKLEKYIPRCMIDDCW